MLITGTNEEIENAATNWEKIFVTQLFCESSLIFKTLKILVIYAVNKTKTQCYPFKLYGFVSSNYHFCVPHEA